MKMLPLEKYTIFIKELYKITKQNIEWTDIRELAIGRYILDNDVNYIHATSLPVPKEVFLTLTKILQDTNVTILDISFNALAEFAPQIALNLRGTKVTTLDISSNRLAEHAAEFAHNLVGTNVTTLNMRSNRLAEHAAEFAHNLVGTNVTTLNISYNNLAEHAANFAYNLSGTNVNKLDICANDLAEHAAEFAYNLRDTNVIALDIGCNNLAEHSLAFSLNLKYTKIITLCVNENKLEDNSQEFFKNIYKTSNVKELYFGLNSKLALIPNVLSYSNRFLTKTDLWFLKNDNYNTIETLVKGFLHDTIDIEQSVDIIGIITDYSMNQCTFNLDVSL